MIKKSGLAMAVGMLCAANAHADVKLIAVGNIDATYEDRSADTGGELENGVHGNRLGGIGSGLAHAGGTIFLGLPDRGPNANPYNGNVDDTVSYIARFHTIDMRLSPSDPGAMLPFTLTPTMLDTTLLSSPTRLTYGTGAGLGTQVDGVTPLGSGAPALNFADRTHYFSGRSDNFDPLRPSTDPGNARLDPEGIRVSNNGESVYVSDEYGPFLYEFNRRTGKRIRSFKLPANLAITNLSSQKDVEIGGNTVGRVTNKGMEGLAITPSGRMLVGAMQANLEQDKKKSLRLVTVDTRTGETHEYAYLLTKGSGISEIVAVNEHQFLVDERDGSGFADTPLLTDTASAAEVKQLYLIDLDGARDISNVSGDLSTYAVGKTLFLDIVKKVQPYIDPLYIPSKIEGVAFGPDVRIGGRKQHTLYIANDNDFLARVADPTKGPGDGSRGLVANPNVIYVFAFEDSDLPGYVPQPFRGDRDHDYDHDHDYRHDHDADRRH